MKKFILAFVIAIALPAFATLTDVSDGRQTAVGNGATVAFTFSFPAGAASDISAIVKLAGITQSAPYSVVLNSDQSVSPGGTVTFTSAPANATAITIQRSELLTQRTVLNPYSPFPAKTVERTFDGTVRKVQQVNRRVADLETKEASDVSSIVVGGLPALNLAQIIATGSTTGFTLPDRFAQTKNVKNYGATGLGLVDDTSAINLAIADAVATGGAVYFPPGTYLARAVAIANPAVIFGAGRELVTLKLPVLASLDGSPILNITSGGVSVRGITFDGQKASQPADGFSDSFNTGLNNTGRAYRAAIRAYNVGSTIVNLSIEDCGFLNTYGAGLAAQNVAHGKFRRNTASGTNFEVAMFYSTSVAGSGPYYAGQEVVDNEATNVGTGDPTTNGNAFILNHAIEFVFAHNYGSNVERNLVKCEDCKNGVIRGNTIDTVTVANFAGIQLQQGATNVTVEGNKITNCGNGIAVNLANGGANISFVGNVIDTVTNQGDGIPFSLGAPVAGILVSNNIMRAVTRIGINLASGAWTNAVITSNNIKTISGAGNQAGININVDTAGTSGLTISNNLFDLNAATSSSAGMNFSQGGGQTVSKVTMIGNSVINQSGRTAITDNLTTVISSGVFGGNSTDGGLRFGSTALQSIAPNSAAAGTTTGGFWLLGLQPTSVTFANLGTPSNFTVLGCSDCTIANPCAGGGTGAIAKRLNGVWVCN